MSSTASASTVKRGREPPLKKKKKEEPSTEPTTIPSLPYDLLVSCLAHVSRIYYPTLSLVTKTFRSIVASPELYHTRNLSGHTEYCLYVCLQFSPDSDPRWFTLCRKPNKALITDHINKKGKKKMEKEKTSDYGLVSIRILNSPNVDLSNLIAVGSNLYAINGSIEESVSFLDCRTHTWLEAPRMRIAHSDGEYDGQMYLPGSNENPNSLNCIEVFDRKIQTWKPVPPEKRIFNGRNMEGKIYMDFDGMFGKYGLAVNPKKMTKELVGLDSDKDFNRVSACVIDNIIYCYKSSDQLFEWLDEEADYGGKLEGLEGLPKFSRYSSVKLVDYGGKMLVLWDKYVPVRGGYKEKMIWCAVIKLERRNNNIEIWGKVEWCDAVLKVPKSYKFVCAIAAIV